MRRFLLLAGSLTALGFLGQSARAGADDYACTVYLCMAPGGPGWQTIPACVGPVGEIGERGKRVARAVLTRIMDAGARVVVAASA